MINRSRIPSEQKQVSNMSFEENKSLVPYIPISLKNKVFDQCVLLVPIYGVKTWIITKTSAIKFK